MKHKTYFTKHKKQYGFSLVELLFAIFIVALGIVGVIITMNRLVQFQNEARGDQRAATALSELTQRLRMIEMISTLSTNPINNAVFNVVDNATCINIPCTLQQLTQRSMTDWRNNRVQNILGAGAVGTINALVVPAGNPRAFSATLRWPSTADNLDISAAYRSCTANGGVAGAGTTNRCAQVVILP